jgi:glycerol uptake facilitator-like aquaporin
MVIDKKKIAVVLAEFLGTAILSLVILSVKNSAIGIPYFVAIAGGLTVALVYLNAGDISRIQINPAVTVALWTVKKVATVEAVLRIGFQLLGGFVALKVFTYFQNSPLQNVAPAHYSSRIMVAEAVGAFVFAMALAAAASKKFDRLQTGVLAGGSFLIAMVIAAAAGNGLVNPAVALAVRSWGWNTYVLGPVVGAVVGVNLYMMIFAEKETSTSKKRK